MGTFHTIENSQHLVEKIKALDPHMREMFHSKRPHAIEPPFRLILESQLGMATTETSFIALSYCWHDVNKWAPVHGCKPGEGLPISDQCFREALRLREPGDGIWIDQLCINQRDEKEKERAIASMDLVYKHARLIVIVIEDTTMLESEASMIEEYQNGILQKHRLTVWNVISKIGNSRWFQRAWCSHEFHLCQDAVFVIPCKGRSPLSLRLSILQRLLQFKESWAPVSMVLSDESLEGYRNLAFLLTSRYVLSKKYPLDKPVVGICYLVNRLQASVLGDKVSIALSLLDFGLYFRGTVFSEAHCRYIFALLALAAGDPLVLCCSGKTLDNDGYGWTNRSLDLTCLQWPVTSDLVHFSNRYPRVVQQLNNQISFRNGRMMADILALSKLDCKPNLENLERSHNFLQSIFENPKILASIEPEDLTHPVLDKKTLLENGVVYLACALDLGFDWMLMALRNMRCSPTVQGLRADSWAGVGDSLWHSAGMHLLSTNSWDESLRTTLVDFFIFAFQHILLLGETAQNIAAVTFSNPATVRAMVSLPPGYRAEELLLAVPVSLSEPENAFIKRL
ncbi:heterokaryon incompatibility protein-domain-containing protein [Phaeosphaeriaceae sp. PMI808]|nr:heterokaryon incompatibility protein-domain-containing protein [Phaeosphaeriaceae sp. PMI808]